MISKVLCRVVKSLTFSDFTIRSKVKYQLDLIHTLCVYETRKYTIPLASA